MKTLKVKDADHTAIKTLAAAAGKTIMAFMKDLIASYRKGSK